MITIEGIPIEELDCRPRVYCELCEEWELANEKGEVSDFCPSCQENWT